MELTQELSLSSDVGKWVLSTLNASGSKPKVWRGGSVGRESILYVEFVIVAVLTVSRCWDECEVKRRGTVM